MFSAQHTTTTSFPVSYNTSISSVTVTAVARLHMGFLDISGTLGRKFGGLGVGINEIITRVRVTPSRVLSTEGPDAERALQIAQALHSRIPYPAQISIEQSIPRHIGLGSGTQLGLAIGTGLARLHNIPVSAREIALLIQRGARSGIGIAVFEEGGLVVDGGRGNDTLTPPVLARFSMPSEWRFLLVLDLKNQGLHGAAEREAFQALPAFPEHEAARLCHWLLIRGLPALAEGDLPTFGMVIAELQRSVGDHFAPAQGGRFISPHVEAALHFLASRGAVGVGQSSWGPTGFCFAGSPIQAETLLNEAKESFKHSDLLFRIGTPCHQGAQITVEN